MINKVPGQRWAFNNVGTCTWHVTAQFVVEIVTINEYYSCTVRTIQSSLQVFKLGKKWLCHLDKECDKGCYQYLPGQDKPKDK